MEKRTGDWLLVITVLIILLLTLLLLYTGEEQKIVKQATEAQTVSDVIKKLPKPQAETNVEGIKLGIAVNAYIEIQENGNTLLNFKNNYKNNCEERLELYVTDAEGREALIYKSGAVKSGEELESAVIKTELEKGKYTGYAKVVALDTKGNDYVSGTVDIYLTIK